MKKYFILSILLSSNAFSIEPLSFIEGEWRGTYEQETGSSFTIKNGMLSLGQWDCPNNPIKLLSFKEMEKADPDSIEDWMTNFFEITIEVKFNSNSKGCPNNPNIFKYYKYSSGFESPLRIKIKKDICSKYEHAVMNWKNNGGYYYRIGNREPLPAHCNK